MNCPPGGEKRDERGVEFVFLFVGRRHWVVDSAAFVFSRRGGGIDTGKVHSDCDSMLALYPGIMVPCFRFSGRAGTELRSPMAVSKH